MSLDDILDENINNDSGRDYSRNETPIDMGKWISYMPYHDQNQLELQLENILRLPIENSYGQIGFILSKNINKIEEYLEDISSKIKIENTKTILETEVFYTSKIEGANTTLKRTGEIHNGSKIDFNNKYSESMIKGNFEAVKLLNLYGNTIDQSKLYKIWDVLTKDCRDNTEIEGDLYRKGDVTVSNSDFVSVPYYELPDKMDNFINFYNNDILNDKPFIKACLIHYTFETIHPFCDGNGRLGRLLMNNYLISQGIESCRAVSFSMQIDKNRGLYDAAFIDSENKYADSTPFIEYMLNVMAESYLTAYQVQNN